MSTAGAPGTAMVKDPGGGRGEVANEEHPPARRRRAQEGQNAGPAPVDHLPLGVAAVERGLLLAKGDERLVFGQQRMRIGHLGGDVDAVVLAAGEPGRPVVKPKPGPVAFQRNGVRFCWSAVPAPPSMPISSP